MMASSAIVQSDALSELVLFTRDELSKFALIQAGLRPGIIYTRRELKRVVSGQVTAENLLLIHHVKKMFDGTIKEPHEN
jgi:hypothetical protein